MSRAPFQILVLPYRLNLSGKSEFAIFKRSNGSYWQFIAGGGEDQESPLAAARREAIEEAQIPPDSSFLKLDTENTIPVVGVTGEFTWGSEVLVIPEYTFAVEIHNPELVLSPEHTAYRWVDYETAHNLLKWDSNRNALWELRERLRRTDGS